MIKIKSIEYIQQLGNFKDVVTHVNWVYKVEGFEPLEGVFGLPVPNSNSKFTEISKLELKTIEEWVKKIIQPDLLTLVPIQENVTKKIEFQY